MSCRKYHIIHSDKHLLLLLHVLLTDVGVRLISCGHILRATAIKQPIYYRWVLKCLVDRLNITRELFQLQHQNVIIIQRSNL